MRDRNHQRPVFLVRVAQGASRVADIEAFSRSSAVLRSEEVPFKVLESVGGPLGEHSVFLIPEEFKDQAFNIASGNGQTNVIYPAFDRTAYLRSQSDTTGTSGKVLGSLNAIEAGEAANGEVFTDANRAQSYAIR